MFRSIAHTGIRTRLLGGFAPICMLLAATVVYTVLAVSNISARIKPVVDRRAPIAIASTELVGNLAAAGSQLQTLAASTGTVSGAIAETSRSAGNVMGAASQVSGASERLAAEVQAFFVKLRNGSTDRRDSSGTCHLATERRSGADVA